MKKQKCKICGKPLSFSNAEKHTECYVTERAKDSTFRMRREALGLSIKEVAEQTGMSVEEIEEIEKHS